MCSPFPYSSFFLGIQLFSLLSIYGNLKRHFWTVFLRLFFFLLLFSPLCLMVSKVTVKKTNLEIKTTIYAQYTPKIMPHCIVGHQWRYKKVFFWHSFYDGSTIRNQRIKLVFNNKQKCHKKSLVEMSLNGGCSSIFFSLKTYLNWAHKILTLKNV